MRKTTQTCIGMAAAILLSGCSDPGWADINSRPATLPECQLTGDVDEPAHEGGAGTALQTRCHPESMPGWRLPPQTRPGKP